MASGVLCHLHQDQQSQPPPQQQQQYQYSSHRAGITFVTPQQVPVDLLMHSLMKTQDTRNEGGVDFRS